MAGPWYNSLTHPPGTPPDWVFGPVWILLYMMIGTSILVYVLHAIKRELRQELRTTCILLAIHLAINLSWTALFFGLQQPIWALIDLILLDLTLLWIIKRIASVSLFARDLLIPYLLWILYATYLNAGIVVLN
jgi:benzodiazapine receptor